MAYTIRTMVPPVDRVDHLPDASLGLCIVRYATGRTGMFFVGPWTRALYTWPAPFHYALHIAFAPGTGFPFIGVPLDALADRIVDAADLWGPLARRVHAELDELDARDGMTMAARIAVVERALREQQQRHVREPAAAALARAAARHLDVASTPISDLASDLHASERSLRRAFAASVGVAPKEYARIRRFRRALAATSASRGDLARLALDAGYADHAHLSNEFRLLARVPPTTLASAAATDALRTACPLATAAA